MRSHTERKYSALRSAARMLGCLMLMLVVLAVPAVRSLADGVPEQGGPAAPAQGTQTPSGTLPQGIQTAARGLTQVNPAYDSITVQWNPMGENVERYHVYAGTSAQDAVAVADLDATVTTATIGDLTPGSTRYIKVTYDYWNYNHTRLYTGADARTAGVLSNARTFPARVMNIRQDKWYSVAKVFWVRWDKLDSVDGYEYMINTSGGDLVGTGTVKPLARPAVSLSGISNQRIYTVRARAYADIGGQRCFGEWSDKIYCFTQPKVKKAAVSAKNRLTIRWGKVSGATGYEVYVSTKKKSGYKKVKTTGKNKTSVTLSEFRGKKISAKKRYYVYVVTKKKVGKTTYRSGKLYYWNTKNAAVGYF